MMELKVWVDGIPRVVSGATYDTTCQDVVIALAQAINRTGRFTLSEKWRNSSRPLAPEECPLQVLHKWGEYGPEVHFILCQLSAEDGKEPARDRLLKKRGDQHAVANNFVLPHKPMTTESTSVKRSLTFNGACGLFPRTSTVMTSAAANKFRKTQKGSVPNGDVQQMSGPDGRQPPPHPLPKQQNTVGGSQQGDLPRTSQHPHPVPPPRHHVHSARSQPVRNNAHNSTSMSESSTSTSDLASESHNEKNVSSYQPLPAARSHVVSSVSPTSPRSLPDTLPPSYSKPQVSPRSLTQSQTQPVRTVQEPHPVQTPKQNVFSEDPPPLPSSAPPSSADLVTIHPDDLGGVQDLEPSLGVIETTMDSPDHSRRASLEIEEYDLEHNFPDKHREYGHPERPSVGLEYCLDDEMGSGADNRLEEERTKLLSLVNSLQEELMSRESQIGLINIEISTLEEKEKEYEEKLQLIMEELLHQETLQRDLDVQLGDLENIEWDNVLDGEKKCEVDLTQKIASTKAAVLELEEKLAGARTKEQTLLNEVNKEEEKISAEKERLKAEEAKSREKEEKTKDEISQLQTAFAEEQRKTEEYEASLIDVDEELKRMEKDLMEKQATVTETEAELKDENLKEFVTQPAPKEDSKSMESGETVLKILEGRLSPRPPASPSGSPADSPHSPSFMATLTASSQNSVWV